MPNDIFTVDDSNNAAVRTVGVKGITESNKTDIFTIDENGNAAVRVVGGGGSVDEDHIIVKSAEIPEASADVLGQMYCYSGETNNTYTHGYIYECVAGSTYYTANIAFEQSTFASESFEKAGQLIIDAGVTDPTQVTGGTMTYALAGNLWSIVFTDENGNALNTAYNIYTDDLEQDYDILPVIDPSEFTDGQVVNMLINNIEAHQNYSWERLDVQPAAKLGRYLSSWNCATGLAGTNPPESPYEYTTGDYFVVGTVATGGGTNYRPNGSSYVIGQASTTVETSAVEVNDTYLYDGTNWTLMKTGSAVTSVNGQTGDVTVQETLVSGTNIKTINGNSLLGSGNIAISGGVPQYTTMPVASASNVGVICQFAGTSTQNYEQGYFYICNPVYVDAEATISQTTGSGLTNLAVDVATFETAEQPTGDETVEFTASGSQNVFNCETDISGATVVCPDINALATYVGSQVGMPASWVIDQINAGQGFSFNAGHATGEKCEFGGRGLADDFFDTYFVFDPEHANQSAYMFSVWGSVSETAAWTKDGNTVNLADYGITYSGTPVAGDTLTVAYTASAITGYTWEQINVQPAPAGGIKWDATIDLPDTYDGSAVNAMWTIAGGLPDGNYEFYFQTKCTNDSATTTPFQMVTYKLVLSIYSDEFQSRYYKGFYAPVIDGNFMPDGNYTLSATSSYWNLRLTVVDGDLIMWGPDRPFFQTDIPQYRGYTAVNECFKLSKIVNIDTGEEYSATGSILTNDPSGSDIIGYGLEYKLYQEQYIPTMQVYNQYSVSELATQNAGIVLYLQNEIAYKNIKSLNISLSHPDSNAEFEVNLTFGAYGKDCVQEIVKATGVFANCYVGYVEGFNTYITGFDNVLAQTLTGWFNINSGSIASTQIPNSMTVISGTVIPYTQGGNKAYRFDTPTANSLGNILQYVGETDANYTNGYFYKATGTIVTTPENITTEVFDPQGEATVTIDAPNFVNALMTEFGWSRQQIEEWFVNYATSEFSCDYDIDNNQVVGLALPWHGGIFATSILQYITVVYTGSVPTGTITIRFYATYTPESKSVQNPAWTQITTQPAPTAPATMPTLTVANWSSNTQTVTVNGVTASNSVLVAPAPASATDWSSAGIICTAQATNSLTFTCATTPTNDITVNVCILN